MGVRFCPIASGSSGNCIYVNSGEAHILIDAGLSGKRIKSGLDALGVHGEDINGIFVTHEHADHITGAGILSRRYDIPIYATPRTWRFFQRHNTIGRIQEKNIKMIEPGEDTSVGTMVIKAFDIPHDSSQPVGYCVFTNKYKITVATDIGHVTDEVRNGICDSDILLLESNHDVEMLLNGRYPKVLKDRVMGGRGHLSNVTAGQLISEVMSEKLRYVYLGHLSEENNRPLIALDTVKSILEASHARTGHFRLDIAHRDVISELVELE